MLKSKLFPNFVLQNRKTYGDFLCRSLSCIVRELSLTIFCSAKSKIGKAWLIITRSFIYLPTIYDLYSLSYGNPDLAIAKVIFSNLLATAIRATFLGFPLANNL